MAPPSQKYRTIGFVLTGGAGGTLDFTFSIRPEDLRRPEPSRTNIQQTLGGVLVDSFGAGISTINLSGHNGWRGGFLSSGEELFADLRATVFKQWHARRQQQIAEGNDPNDIELHYVDTLDDISVIVAPMGFDLSRSRSSPLLMRYNIQLTVLGDIGDGDSDDDSILSALTNPLRWLASVTGLGNVLTSLQNGLAFVQNAYAVGQTYVGAFMTTAMDVLGAVHTLVGLASPGGILSGDLSAVLAAGLGIAGAATNVFRVLASDPTLTSQDQAQLAGIASDFLEASCLISNGFATGQTYTSLDDMLGASNCSSTGGGGAPSAFTLADTNPFADLFSIPSTTPAIAISTEAQSALMTLQGDVLHLTADMVTPAATAIATGITLGGTLVLLPPLTPARDHNSDYFPVDYT